MQEREIQTISFGNAARTRLGMYLSADQQEALELGLREIYVNSLDALTETNAKNGKIEIIINSKEKTIKVQDNGPGIPNISREDKVPSLVAAYTLPHTGSHFDDRQVNSIGVNGIGASVVTHTAKWFRVYSINNGESCLAFFESNENGAQLQEFIPTKSNAKTGVIVEYEPDELIYGEAWFNEDNLIFALSEMMKFYPKVSLTLNFDGHKSDFHFPNGLKEKNTKLYYESDNLIIALSLTDSKIKAFGNRLYLPNGGAFFTHFKTQLTRMVNDLSGLKLSGNEVQAVFSGYIAVFVNNPLFSNQSKTAISNKEVNNEITAALKTELENFSKTTEWDRVIKELEAEMKAEEAAERARNKVKNALAEIDKGSKKKVVVSDKLKDCLAHGEQAWLAVSEGDSAQGALNLGRDIETVATFPIRGKFINCLKNKKEDYLANEELIQIAQILGCGLFEKYNPKKLKYGNVLIAVDADVDGLNIACLLTTFFYVCMPEFIQEGRLWWMKAPLYTKGREAIFTEEEWSKVKNKKGWKRNKGLGEMLPNEVEQHMFGSTRRWIQLKPATWPTLKKTIEDLMGKDVSIRREFLFNNIDFERIKFL